MYSIGQVVYSKSGRDKGNPFIVVSINGEFLYLSDGDTRRLEKPKKKKVKHVQPTNSIKLDIKEKLLNKAYLTDSDLRKALKAHRANKEVTGVVEG